MPLISSWKIADGICFSNNTVGDDYCRERRISTFLLIDQILYNKSPFWIAFHSP